MLPRSEHIFVFIRGNIASDRITVNDAVSSVIRFSSSKLEQFNLVNPDLFVVRIDLTTYLGKYKGNEQVLVTNRPKNLLWILSLSRSRSFPYNSVNAIGEIRRVCGLAKKTNTWRSFSFFYR